jgi:hypothetical protein
MRMSTTHGGYTADVDLRARIEAFSPDEPGVALPFSARLARENGWTREHALAVTREYLRFVYLAMTAGHPVTPSRAVDEAWHLHLTCTRSYWEEMCGRVLGRPLHHDPTRGGAEEEAKFADWYARTLDSYRAALGEEPPVAIWPRPRMEAATPAPAPGSAGSRPGWPALFVAALLAAVLVGACTGEEPIGLIVGVVMVAVLGIVHMATAPHPALRTPAPGAERKRAAAGGAAGGDFVWVADAGGSDGGGAHHDGGGHHGGCSGHPGCSGHGGCGHGGCGHGGCGSGH